MKKRLLLSFLLSLAVSSLAMAQYTNWQEIKPPPVVGASFTISKGNNYFFMGSYYDGLYRSTDKGATWQQVYYTPSEKVFYSVEVRQDGVVFAGGIGAVYRSTDQGTTWTKLPLTSAPNTAVTQIAFSEEKEVFLGTQDISAPPSVWPSLEAGAGVFKSTDNGGTWTPLNAGLEGSSKSIGAIVVDVNNRLFIGVQDGSTKETGGVFTLGKGETTWVRKPLVTQHDTYLRTVIPTQIYDLALDGMGTLFVTAEGLSAVSGIPARVACRAMLTSSNAGTTWSPSHIVANPGQYAVEPVPQKLFLAGTQSNWTSTLLGHVTGNTPNVSGMYVLPDGAAWSKVSGPQVITTFNLHFAEDNQGEVYALEDFNAKLFKSATVNGSSGELPFTVVRAYPNPAVGDVTLSFSLSAAAWVQVLVLDLLGSPVKQLAPEKLSPGNHQVTWNTQSHPAGTYLLKLVVNGNASVQKVMVVK